MNKYNEVAKKIFQDKGMKTCPGCKRRFLPDPYTVHMKSCKAASSSGGAHTSLDHVKASKMSSRPRLLMCPLCGREFGTLSLPIHMKTCRVRFELEQEQLPRNQRKSADKIIEQFEKSNQTLKSNGDYNVDNMNQDAYEIFTKEALAECELCGRTFLPDRLIVHLRSCKGPKKEKQK